MAMMSSSSMAASKRPREVAPPSEFEPGEPEAKAIRWCLAAAAPGPLSRPGETQRSDVTEDFSFDFRHGSAPCLVDCTGFLVRAESAGKAASQLDDDAASELSLVDMVEMKASLSSLDDSLDSIEAFLCNEDLPLDSAAAAAEAPASRGFSFWLEAPSPPEDQQDHSSCWKDEQQQAADSPGDSDTSCDLHLTCLDSLVPDLAC